MRKILFCATVDIHFEAFHLPYLKWFKDQGWEVHVASSGKSILPYVDKKIEINIKRSPFSKGNLEAYRELRDIIIKNQYKIIHCHTPMGGVLTRLAARVTRKHGSKVIYTAHGFHFFKGAPFINWALYYPIERFLSSYTDCLITINEEDYQLASKHQFKAQHLEHVHGVGVNVNTFFPVNLFHKLILRKEQGYTQEDFLMIYAAEFNKNKNQNFLIKSLAQIKEEFPFAKLLLAGDGPLLEHCMNLSKELGVEERVHFLGYRRDIEVLLKMSDLAVASSYREGLPVNVMEAMACGLPVLASDNRGHRELVQNNENGWIVKANNIEFFSGKLRELIKNEDIRSRFGKSSRNLIEEKYSIENVLKEKSQIYSMFMEEMEELKWAAH